MDATVRNMRAVQAAGRKCVAWDSKTDDTFSASPGDYFYMTEDERMVGEFGTPLVLVTVSTVYAPVVLDESASSSPA